MRLFDRITDFSVEGGAHGRGCVRAELDVSPDHWIFRAGWSGEAAMPPALELDALWQLLGLLLDRIDGPGRCRALSVRDLRVSGLVLPGAALVEYGVDLKRVKRARVTVGVADGWTSVDGTPILRASGLRVALFRGDPAGP